MNNNNDVLSPSEQFINLIYYIFKYTIYILGFYFIMSNFGETCSMIVGIIFTYLHLIHKSCDEHIQYSIIQEEREDAIESVREKEIL